MESSKPLPVQKAKVSRSRAPLGLTTLAAVAFIALSFYQPAADSQLTKPPIDPTRLEAPLPRNLFIELSRSINPAVVSISTSQHLRMNRMRSRDPLQQFLEDFGGLPRGGGPGQPPPAQAMGTGFIIRPDGLIVTNNHVIEGADTIKVQIESEPLKFHEATLIGSDKQTDIALLKIDAKRQLPYAQLGTSKDLAVGEWVAAFGNPYGHAHTMTKGIISAIGREIGELNRFPFIQTDASINPGNSGGPLVNSQGYVVGVNTAIDARAQGIGFAIPIDNVKSIIKQLESNGRVKRGFIGVGISDVTPDLASSLGMATTAGVLVNQVVKGSPADKAGVEVYGIITEFNGKPTNTALELSNAVASTDIGSKTSMKIIRVEGSRKVEKSLSVSITESPDDRRSGREEPSRRQYLGQKAPFDLGFRVADMTPQMQKEFEIPPGTPKGPVIIDVERGSQASEAGLAVGDIILDINRTPVTRATEVIRSLRNGMNVVRVARGGTIAIVPLEASPQR